METAIIFSEHLNVNFTHSLSVHELRICTVHERCSCSKKRILVPTLALAFIYSL